MSTWRKYFVAAAVSAAVLFCCQSAGAADYETSGTINYTSTTSDLAALLGETPAGAFSWAHNGNVNMYAGGLITSLANVPNGTPAYLELKDATISVSGSFNVAAAGKVNGEDAGGSGELVLDNTTMTVGGFFNVSCGNALGDKVANPIVGRVTLRNGTHLTVYNQCQMSANAGKSGEWNAQVTNVLVLSSGSVLTTRDNLSRWDGPSGMVVFDGGMLEKAADVNNGFFNPNGYGYDGKSTMLITNTPGNDVVLKNSQTNMLFIAQNTCYLLVDGAIRKQGRGVMVFPGPSGNNSDHKNSLAFNGLSIEEGTVKLFNAYTFLDPVQYPADRRGTVLIAAGARLDLNNNDAFIEDLTGEGTILASYMTGAALTLCNEVDSNPLTDKVRVSAGITTLEKRGNSVTQVAALGADIGTTAVSAGTLRIVEPAFGVPAFTHYRFRVTKVNDENNANQIMELREIKLMEGDADVTFAAAYKWDSTTTQTGGSGIFGNDETPNKAYDMNLTSKWCDLRLVDQNCWWIEFVYDAPVQVTAYNWAKTDNGYRSPKAWVLEGSDDGETWTIVDSREMDTADLPKDAWVSAEPFAVAPAAKGRVEKLGAVTVASGATLDLSALACDVEVSSISGGGTIALGSGAFVVNNDADTVIETTQFTGSPSAIVKKGTGTLSVYGALPAPLDVREGEVAPAAGTIGFSGKYFRFKIKATRTKQDVGELGKLNFFAADGSAVATGLKWYGADNLPGWMYVNDKDGTPASELPAGTFSQGGQYKYSYWNGDHQTPACIFYDPANTANKWCTIQHQFDVNVDSTWYVLNMRLADDAPNVVGYNLKTANGDNNDRPVAAWALYGSDDGETWTLLDERNLGTSAPNKANTWYNNGTPSTARGESFPIGDTQAAISADDVPPIGSLVVDLAGTSGTLARFKPAANGTLVILNAPDGTDFSGWTVPLSVGEFSTDASSSLRSWSIVVDGVALGRYRLAVSGGDLVVEKKAGFSVFVR